MKKQRIATIGIGPDYFRTTVRNDSRYPLAWRWVKETLQNAVDAKATEIIYTLDARSKTFEVVDNGVGMTADVILDKFLMVGGSKKSGNSVGGFGDAKQVICFCWDEWELESNKSYLSKEMLGVEPIKALKSSRNGTRIKAELDTYFDVKAAVSYIELCELKVKVRVIVIDEDGSKSEVKLTKFVTGKPLESNLTFGDLYTGKYVRSRERLNACVVRINGLAMFWKELPSVKQDMILELTNLGDPKSTDYILQVQREGLKWQYDLQLEKVLQMYVSEPHRAARDASKNDNLVTVFNGSGTCQSMSSLMSTERISINHEGVQFDVPVNLAQQIEKFMNGMDQSAFNELVSSYSGSEAPIELSAGDVVMMTRSRENAFSDVYPYDFIIKGKTNLRYTSLKYKRLCLLWHKMIQYVLFFNLLEGNEIEIGDYKIGFVFPSDENIKAQYMELESSREPVLLLNPDVQVSNWRGTVLEVMDRAVHEITHRFCPYHDGVFMELYNRIKSICYMNIDSFFSIGNSILKATKDTIVQAAEMDEDYNIVEA